MSGLFQNLAPDAVASATHAVNKSFDDGLLFADDRSSSYEHGDGELGEPEDSMGMGLFGFLFISLLLVISLVISFRWCCKRMRQYNEFVRGIEEEHERRRQVEEDLWIFTIQHEQQNPRIRYEDSSTQRARPAVELLSRDQKPLDELPSYEEAVKLPPIYAKDTTTHV